MPTSWRLVKTAAADAAQTMAVDCAILEEAIAEVTTTPIVRFYEWADPSLSFGANRSLSEEVIRRCERSGVQVVRRPTGGGAVFHHNDLTYSVVAPCTHGVLGTYQWVAGGLIQGFAHLGLRACVSSHVGRATAMACFAQPTGADLEIGGRKICGSAQVRRGGWFLQHGSIPITDVRAITAGLLGLRGADDSTFMNELVPGLRFKDLVEALTQGFTTHWGTVAQPSSYGLD